MPKLAAGILLCRRAPDARVEVLLVLPRSARRSGSRAGAWSVPKGKPLPRERLIDAARREFEEETAQPAPGRLVELGTVDEPNGKQVAVWAAETAWADVRPVPGPTARSEIAEVAWVDLDRARALLRPAQVPFLKRLVRRVASGGLPTRQEDPGTATDPRAILDA